MVWLKIAIFTVLAPGTVLFYLPYAIGSAAAAAMSLGPLRFAGLPLILVGFAIYLRCAWDFGSRGRGTPAPIDPPRELVVQGLYRYVRNPMYVGGLTILIGQVLWFRAPALLLYAGAVFLAFYLFVVVYEEPALTRKFGESYLRYRNAVPRWIPHRPSA